MHMHSCVYVYVHVHVHAYIHASLYIYIYMYMYVHMSVSLSLSIYIYMYAIRGLLFGVWRLISTQSQRRRPLQEVQLVLHEGVFRFWPSGTKLLNSYSDYETVPEGLSLTATMDPCGCSHKGPTSWDPFEGRNRLCLSMRVLLVGVLIMRALLVKSILRPLDFVDSHVQQANAGSKRPILTPSAGFQPGLLTLFSDRLLLLANPRP